MVGAGVGVCRAVSFITGGTQPIGGLSSMMRAPRRLEKQEAGIGEIVSILGVSTRVAVAPVRVISAKKVFIDN